ncbi:MAG: hypothetical protein ABJA20_00480 [Novosphingobium sp.]
MSKLPDPESERNRIIRQRNIIMALALGALVVLFFFITIAKIRH